MISMAKPLLGNEEKEAVQQVLDSGMLAQGSKVAQFEREFATFIGTKHAIATSNGTTALHAALEAHSITKGDEVITSPFSFIATANAVRMTGATPVFVDIEEESFNINPELIEAAITPKTKAILPVHLFGLPAQMDKIMEIAQKHHLFVIEDACQAHGAEFQGKKVGSFGTGCFSFYATKNMTTGEGGMITTNDEALALKLRKIISHGSEKKYHHEFHGYNYRMTDIAAAIGIPQLKKLAQFNAIRQKNALFLNAHLNISGINTPKIFPDHVFHQYTIRVTPEYQATRDEVMQQLSARGINSAIFYPIPIHKQKAYSTYHHLSFPVAEKAAQQALSLPIHPALSEDELKHIAEAFH